MFPLAGPTMVSVLFVSLLSFVGAVGVAIDRERLQQILPLIVATAIGVLLGDALVHMIPEALAHSHSTWQTLDIVGLGMIAFAAIEAFLHMFDKRENGIAPFGMVSVVAESVHNALDGILIAGAYLTGFGAGVAATVAVILHEIPHELGNFAVLLHAGFPARRALWLNFASACSALVGAAAMLAFGANIRGAADFAGPFAAGGFLFLALGSLTPSLWRDASPRQRRLILAFALMGVALMGVLRLILG